MRSPKARGKRRDPLPALIVEMRWQDGSWGWCDVRTEDAPSQMDPPDDYERSLGYVHVKYIPAPRGRRRK